MNGPRRRTSEPRLWGESILFTAVAIGAPGWFAAFGPGRALGPVALSAAWAAYYAALAAAWWGTARLRTRRFRRVRREYQRNFGPYGTARRGGH